MKGGECLTESLRRAFVLNFGDGESIQNGIGHTVIAEKAGAWFDLNGRRLNGKLRTLRPKASDKHSEM